MAKAKKFLIVDGYPKESRDQFNQVGMRLAWELYRDMLVQYIPDAQCDVYLSSDPGVNPPTDSELAEYAGILWPGCNLTIYHLEDPRVICHRLLADRAYEAGIPQFGTCWGIQLAVAVAGGEVAPHPNGREMGIGRKIRQTDAGRVHPMYVGKPIVFDGYASHDDEVTRLPECATLLASNDWSRVHAVSVEYKNGTFWGIQYHPEYNLNEMAALMTAREAKLVSLGLFADHDDLVAYVTKLKALHNAQDCKHLRWQLGIDDTIIDTETRQREFINWLDRLVLPLAGLPPRG